MIFENSPLPYSNALIQIKSLINSEKFSFQIDCHDSGTESDDLDSEDFNERDMELSEYLYR